MINVLNNKYDCFKTMKQFNISPFYETHRLNNPQWCILTKRLLNWLFSHLPCLLNVN